MTRHVGRARTGVAAVALLLLAVCWGCQSRTQSEGGTERKILDESAEKPSAGDKQSGEKEGGESTVLSVVTPVYARGLPYASVDGEEVRGYLATPQDDEEHPGVVLVHDWWGLNDDVRKAARRLAGEGFNVLAVDLYRGRVATSPGRAEELMRELKKHSDRAVKNLDAARRYLLENTATSSVGVVGWGPGAEMAMGALVHTEGAFGAGVLYYGRVMGDSYDVSRLSAPVLGIFASDDATIPRSRVETFAGRLKKAGPDGSRVRIYSGVGHGFASPSSSTYDERSARRAWSQTVDFLNRHLGGDG
ncbi:MAG: dienelactone hydrolase family protein [Bradymonadaceae bacterium]